MDTEAQPLPASQSTTNISALIFQEQVAKCGQEEIHYLEFRGNGPPSSRLGSPGDVYADVSVEPRQTYARMLGVWTIWVGPQHTIVHPFQPTLCMWLDDSSLIWKEFTPLGTCICFKFIGVSFNQN